MHGILQIGIITFFCHSLYVVFLRHQSMKAGKSMKKTVCQSISGTQHNVNIPTHQEQ